MQSETPPDLRLSSSLHDGLIAFAILMPVVLGALFSLAAWVREGADVPTDADYRLASTALDATYREGKDVLSVLPAWSLRPFVFIRGKDRIAGDELWTAPLHRAERLLVLAEPDSEADVGKLHLNLGESTVVWENARLRLLAFDIKGAKVAHDLRATLSSATTTLRIKKGAVVECPPDRYAGFRCKGRKSWQHVAREHVLVTENGEDVIYAHPPPGGETLVVTWPAVTFGDALVVRSGFTRDGSYKAKTPVRIRIFAEVERGGGRRVEVGKISHDVNFNFERTIFDTPLEVSGRSGALTFEISTARNSSASFAFDAYTVVGNVHSSWSAP